jgi:putative phosphoesterase
MKILVTSDTHGMYDEISDYIAENDGLDFFVHAGDYSKDAENIHYETGLYYYVVRGNNDFFDFDNPDYQVIKLKNHKIYLTHGDNFDVDFTRNRLAEEAKNKKCDIVIYGHTHIYKKEIVDDVLLVNPGSPSLARDGKKGFVLLEINDDQINIKRVNLSRR